MRVRSCNEQLRHAEIMGYRECEREESWRFCWIARFLWLLSLVSCVWAIGLARIPNVVYGAKPEICAAGSLYDILTDERLNHRVDAEMGILEDECAAIMQDFFRNKWKIILLFKMNRNVI